MESEIYGPPPKKQKTLVPPQHAGFLAERSHGNGNGWTSFEYRKYLRLYKFRLSCCYYNKRTSCFGFMQMLMLIRSKYLQRPIRSGLILHVLLQSHPRLTLRLKGRRFSGL